MSAPLTSITTAINAYNDAVKGGGSAKEEISAGPSGSEFADLVKGAINEAKKIGERSEQLSIAGVAERADIGQVVTAVAEAEVTLQTVVTIRDKVLDAYKDIIRMPI
ncbi:MAG: flagellar hook-basal body complex protein FliE [Rhodospirillales bacterium]|nr:flagellar hook-basal body complex protein FliE [Alphaproteobacteria bacterium]MBL6947973.1 flagellar hook-basal body complex protein FliE [Rhodospirillales bacterium]